MKDWTCRVLDDRPCVMCLLFTFIFVNFLYLCGMYFCFFLITAKEGVALRLNYVIKKLKGKYWG